MHPAAPAVSVSISRPLNIDSEAERFSIEQRIVTRVRATADLKEKLNTLTLIARLPPEILGEVFARLVADAYLENVASGYSYHTRPRRNPALPLCLVCRNWHKIAAGTPRMWSWIYRVPPEVALEWLKRSKSTPLFFYDSHAPISDKSSQLLTEVGRNFYRVQEFHLRDSDDRIRTLCSAMSAFAPFLTSLAINVWTYNDRNRGDTIIIPTRIERHGPSRLRTVDLYHIFIKWNNPILSTALTTLSVCGAPKAAKDLGTFSDLVGALRRMPALISLTLENVISSPGADTHATSPILLPHLRHLGLRSWAGTLATFLCALSVSMESLTLTICLDPSDSMNIDGVEALASTLCVLFLTTSAMRHMRLDAVDFRDRPTSLRAWRTPEPVPFPIPLPLTLTMGSQEDIEPLLARLAAGCRPHTLHIDATTRSPHWSTVVGSFPELTTLVVRGTHRASLRRALTHAKDAAALPSLKEMTLEKFTFMDARGRRTRAYKRLLEWLAARRECGSPIERLTVDTARYMDQAVVAGLEELVPILTVQGEVLQAGNFYESDSG